MAGVDPLRVRSLRQAARSLRFGWQVVRTGLGLLFANRDPRTRLSGRLGTAKVAAWSQPIDLAVVKRVGAALGVTVNDVLLAVTAGALRRHLLEHGDAPHDLRVFVPVDLRPRDEPVPVTLGNRFGIVFARLPVSVPDPLDRVRAVHQRMGLVKAGPQAASTFALLAIVGALPSWGHRLAVRILGAKSSAIVTNVPGPRRPVYLAGARLVRLTFWVPQAGSVGLGVSLLSYAGELSIGIAADRNLVPEPARLVAGAQAELADLARRVLGVDDAAVELEQVPFDSDLAAALVAEVQEEYVRRYGGHDETPVDPGEFAAAGGNLPGGPGGVHGHRLRGDATARPAHGGGQADVRPVRAPAPRARPAAAAGPGGPGPGAGLPPGGARDRAGPAGGHRAVHQRGLPAGYRLRALPGLAAVALVRPRPLTRAGDRVSSGPGPARGCSR